MRNVIMFWMVLISHLALSGEKGLAAKYNLQRGNPEIGSMNEMVFGPDGMLFIADAAKAKIFAINTKDNLAAPPIDKFVIEDIESEVATRLGIAKEDILFHDLAVNPISKNLYLSVSLNRQEWNSINFKPNYSYYSTLLIKVNVQTLEISEFVLKNVEFSEIAIDHAPHEDSVGRRRTTVTDMKFHDGKLLFAGMSKKSFGSTFRTVDFPFDSEMKSTKLEMFHYIHGKYETWAPVNVFDVYEDGDSLKVLAVYYCSPLVSFNLEKFEDDQLIRGESISEMWPGASSAWDMVVYNYQGTEYALISLSGRGLAQYKLDDIRSFDGDLRERRRQFRRSDSYQTGSTGVPFKLFPGPVQQLENFDDDHFVVIKRRENGKLYLGLRTKKYLSTW